MNLRRRLLWALGLGWGATPALFAQHVPQEQLLQPYVGVNAVQKGRVKLEIARLADNGFNVPLKVFVASPMTAQDHVRRLLLLSDRNPRPLIAAFEFGPSADQVLISTRVRLGVLRLFMRWRKPLTVCGGSIQRKLKSLNQLVWIKHDAFAFANYSSQVAELHDDCARIDPSPNGDRFSF